ncbi:hypothetical protein ACF0H5_011974 [Mactra antiquata]
MNATLYSLTFLVSVLELVISYRNTERYVEVTESDCNRTYRFNRWRKMTLEYYNTYVYFGKNQQKPVCYLNIVNNDKDKSICIKDIVSERYDVDSDILYRWQHNSCIKMFRYFIGYLPYHLQNGYTCSDFKYKPMCTDKSEVYAVFNDVDELLSQPAIVEIFTKGKYDPITTKRPTTPYWNDNNDDDDYDYEKSMDTGTLMKIVFGSVCVLVFLIACCIFGKVKQSSTTNANGGFHQQPNQQPNYHSVNQQMYTEDAPSYDTLMRQQQTHIDGDGTAWQINDPVFVGGGRLGPMNTPTAPVASAAMNTLTVPVAPTSVIQPTAPEVPPTSTTNLPSNNDQPTPYNNSNEPIVNQSLPSVPPPSYDDLDFKSPPPPYIGLGE